MKKVLITGGSGLIGKRLTALLLKRGYAVNLLGRGKDAKRKYPANEYVWNIENGEVENKALEGVSAIIHLAGAAVADKRWSEERKREIIESRVKSARLLFNFLKNNKHDVKTFISASAVGYYGDCGKEIVTEDNKSGKGFLSEVCRKWEKSATDFSTLGIRVVRCRVGIVLAKSGGALPELTRTIPMGFASYFSKENLYYPWVHIDDVCGIMIHALENETVTGAYNASAPLPLTMKALMAKIIAARKSNALLIPTPPIVIKLALGEMSEMLLSSQRCSAEKILQTGYKFQYPEAEKALYNIYRK